MFLGSLLTACLFQLADHPATYRLEEAANDQSKALEQERDKRLDATQTFKNFEADLLKVMEDLKEMTRARDSAESGLASAQKQDED